MSTPVSGLVKIALKWISCLPGGKGSSIIQYPSDTACVGPPAVPNISEKVTLNAPEWILYFNRSLNSRLSTDRYAPGLLDSSSSAHTCNSSSVLALGSSRKEHSTTFTGISMAFPEGMLHVLSAAPPPANARKNTGSSPWFSLQFSPVSSVTGFLSAGIGRSHCQNLMVHSS